MEREAKARKILAVLSDFLDAPMGQLRVLDVGCSSGIITNVLGRYFRAVTGTDIDQEALAYAAGTKVTNVDFLPADAMELPFRKESFDVVICAHVYEHVPDSARLIREIHRVLKQGGVCFFSAGNRVRLVEPHYRLPFLSILPTALADLYLRLTIKGAHYEEKHLTYWGLKRLVSGFQVLDYTKKILRDPEKYSATDLCTAGSLKQKSAILFARLAYGLVPTYIFLLKKTQP